MTSLDPAFVDGIDILGELLVRFPLEFVEVSLDGEFLGHAMEVQAFDFGSISGLDLFDLVFDLVAIEEVPNQIELVPEVKKGVFGGSSFHERGEMADYLGVELPVSVEQVSCIDEVVPALVQSLLCRSWIKSLEDQNLDLVTVF